MPRPKIKEQLMQPADSNMVCVVPKQNVEILGRALHALSRIGEELYLEPLNGGLTFRTVHSNHSVYAEVHFTNQFFTYYNCPVQPGSQGDDEDDADALKCRINMKSYLAAFRSLPCLRKQVETCLLQIEPTWLMIKFRCHHNLIRTYRLPVIETETLQALYTVDEVPNQLVIGADVFGTAIKNFQSSERDITLAVEERAAILRNYVPGDADPGGIVRSELKLESGEFISFSVRQPTSITFCLKSFRAMLFFSEPANLPLAVKFSSPGSPVVVISDSSTVELRFVLSSLAPEDSDTTRSDSQQLLTPLQGFAGERQVQVRRKTQPVNKASSLDEAWGDDAQPLRTATSNKTSIRKPETSCHQSGPKSSRGKEQSVQPSGSATSQQSLTSAASSTRAVVGTSGPLSRISEARNNNSSSYESSFNTNGAAEGVPTDLVIPPSDEEAEEDEVVPASPPPVKKARFIFQRCFEPTLNSEDLEDEIVYVPDSDEDV